MRILTTSSRHAPNPRGPGPHQNQHIPYHPDIRVLHPPNGRNPQQLTGRNLQHPTGQIPQQPIGRTQLRLNSHYATNLLSTSVPAPAPVPVPARVPAPAPAPRTRATLEVPAPSRMGVLGGAKKRRVAAVSAQTTRPGRSQMGPPPSAQGLRNTVLRSQVILYIPPDLQDGVAALAYLTDDPEPILSMLYVYVQDKPHSAWQISRLKDTHVCESNGRQRVRFHFMSTSGQAQPMYIEFLDRGSRELFIRTIHALHDGTYSASAPDTQNNGVTFAPPAPNGTLVGDQEFHEDSDSTIRPDRPIPVVRLTPPSESNFSQSSAQDGATRTNAPEKTRNLETPPITNGTVQENVNGDGNPLEKVADTSEWTITPEVIRCSEVYKKTTLVSLGDSYEPKAVASTTQSSELDSLVTLQPYYEVLQQVDSCLGQVSFDVEPVFLAGMAAAFVIYYTQQHPELDRAVVQRAVDDFIARRRDHATSAADHSAESHIQSPHEALPAESHVAAIGDKPSESQVEATWVGSTESDARFSTDEAMGDDVQQTAGSQGGRIQYTVDALLSMSHLASEPPSYLREVRIPRIRPSEQPAARRVSQEKPPAARRVNQEQAAQDMNKSANDMAWVMQGSPQFQSIQSVATAPAQQVQDSSRAQLIEPEVVAPSQSVQDTIATMPNPTASEEPRGPGGSGLRGLVWANPLVDARDAGGDTASLANSDGQPTNTYMHDLAQLEPVTPVTASHDTPAFTTGCPLSTPQRIPSEDAHIPASMAPPTTNHQPRQLNVSTPPTLRPSVDKIDIMMSRLTINCQLMLPPGSQTSTPPTAPRQTAPVTPQNDPARAQTTSSQGTVSVVLGVHSQFASQYPSAPSGLNTTTVINPNGTHRPPQSTSTHHRPHTIPASNINGTIRPPQSTSAQQGSHTTPVASMNGTHHPAHSTSAHQGSPIAVSNINGTHRPPQSSSAHQGSQTTRVASIKSSRPKGLAASRHAH